MFDVEIKIKVFDQIDDFNPFYNYIIMQKMVE